MTLYEGVVDPSERLALVAERLSELLGSLRGSVTTCPMDADARDILEMRRSEVYLPSSGRLPAVQMFNGAVELGSMATTVQRVDGRVRGGIVVAHPAIAGAVVLPAGMFAEGRITYSHQTYAGVATLGLRVLERVRERRIEQFDIEHAMGSVFEDDAV